MSYREAKELAFLRQALRDRWNAQDAGGAVAPLGRLREVAAADGDHELVAEHDRWAFRFQMLLAA